MLKKFIKNVENDYKKFCVSWQAVISWRYEECSISKEDYIEELIKQGSSFIKQKNTESAWMWKDIQPHNNKRTVMESKTCFVVED